MHTKTFVVPNISCGHCKMRVEKALRGLDGVVSADAEVDAKTVTLSWSETDLAWSDIQAALEKIGYPPEQ